MAALDKTTLLVAFLSSDEDVARYERDLLQESQQNSLVKTKVAIGGHSELPFDSVADRYSRPTFAHRCPMIVVRRWTSCSVSCWDCFSPSAVRAGSPQRQRCHKPSCSKCEDVRLMALREKIR